MSNLLRSGLVAVWLAAALLLGGQRAEEALLPSWRDSIVKEELIEFATAVSNVGSPAFVAPEDRIAVFDNDGTLWVEQPIYTEVAFSLARAAEMAREDPKLARRPAFRAALEGDRAAIAGLSQRDMLDLVGTTHSGMTTEAFTAEAREWLATSRHPRFARPYTSAVYQPMVELIDLLRQHGFTVFIVSSGDADFMRTFSASTYGVMPDRVLGSQNKTVFKEIDGRFVLERTPVFIIDEKADKPSNIALQIGRRPIFAAGNSDGDLQMLQYATSGGGRRMGIIVRHDDEEREYAYDRDSKVGRLDKVLDEAQESGWYVVSMKNHWRTIFPPNRARRPLDE